jgi:phosphoribosylformylglycinamidine synthase
MSRVIYLKGGAALSDFRVKKLLDGLKVQGISEVSADFRYFVELKGDLAAADLAFLCDLLHAEPHTPEADVVLVIPRLGTVSPWSSKATDIAANCGLTGL